MSNVFNCLPIAQNVHRHFLFMPADKDWIYDTSKNPYNNCPAHHQFEVNLVSWCLEASETKLTYDDTENVMIIDGHIHPGCFADGFCKPTTKTPFTFDRFFAYSLYNKTLLDERQKLTINIGWKQNI